MKRVFTSFGAFVFSVAALATSSVSFMQATSHQAVAQGGGELPVGAIYASVDATNPATTLGYGTWSAFGAGRTLVGVDAGQTEFDTVEETGGAKTVASAGGNSAPTFTGSALGTHLHGTGTYAASAHAGTAVADHAAHTHSVTSNVTVGDHGSHTHTYTDVVNHTHPVTSQTATTGSATSYEHGTLDTSSAETEATEVTGTPAGGVATGTTAGPSATLTHSVVNNAVTSGNPSATLTHGVTQPSAHTLAGSSSADSAGTPAGTVSAPTFTGSATSVLQPYVTVYYWRRTA